MFCCEIFRNKSDFYFVFTYFKTEIVTNESVFRSRPQRLCFFNQIVNLKNKYELKLCNQCFIEKFSINIELQYTQWIFVPSYVIII